MDTLPSELIGQICYEASDACNDACPTQRVAWPSSFSLVCRAWYTATRRHFLREPVVTNVNAARYLFNQKAVPEELCLVLPRPPNDKDANLSSAVIARCKGVRSIRLVNTMPTDLEELNHDADLERLVVHQTALLRPGYGFNGSLELSALRELTIAADEYIQGLGHFALFVQSSVVPQLQALAVTDPSQTSVTPEVSIYDLIDRALILKLKYLSIPFEVNVIQDEAAFDAPRTLVDFWMHAKPEEGAHLVERELPRIQYLRITTNDAQRGVPRDWAWIDDVVSRCGTSLKAVVLPKIQSNAEAELPKVCGMRSSGLTILVDDVDDNDAAASRISRVFWKWRRPMSFK